MLAILNYSANLIDLRSPVITVLRSMGSDTKRLERIAHEYSQLLYLTRKSEGLRFVETLQPVSKQPFGPSYTLPIWLNDGLSQRIDRISSTLQQDLSSLLSSTIASLQAPPSFAIASHSKHTSTNASKVTDPQNEQKARLEALSDLFRTYGSLRLFREAEDVVRKQVVVDFVTRTIHREALLAPQSPMMPPTPFGGFGSLGSVLSAAANAAAASPSSVMSGSATAGFPFNLPPPPSSGPVVLSPFERQQQQNPPVASSAQSAPEDRTASVPPFYAIDPISSPAQAANGAAASGTYISDALVDLYNKLLVFLSKELGTILEVAERRPALGAAVANAEDSPAASSNTKPLPAAAGAGQMQQSMANSIVLSAASAGAGAGKAGFEILANVFWNEVATRLMAECGHLIFSAGRPEAFHRVRCVRSPFAVFNGD